MTAPGPQAHSHYSLLHHYLESVARYSSQARPPALQRLRETIPSLPSPLALAAGEDAPPATIQQALSLASIALGILPFLEEHARDNPLGWETIAGLHSVLEELAEQLGASLRTEQAHLVRGLYVIIDPQVTGGRDPFTIAQAAVRGGARMLQLRDKLRDKGDSLPLARALQDLCQESGAQLIINDHADVAAIVGSAGLHVGQTDLPVGEARKVLHPGQVLGRSNHEIEELAESEGMGADHLAFGAIYMTRTKGVGRPPQGIEPLRRARAATKLPLVAIGGINAENAAPVVEAGADSICVTAAVGSATEPEAAAAGLVKVIENAGGRV